MGKSTFLGNTELLRDLIVILHRHEQLIAIEGDVLVKRVALGALPLLLIALAKSTVFLMLYRLVVSACSVVSYALSVFDEDSTRRFFVTSKI